MLDLKGYFKITPKPDELLVKYIDKFVHTARLAYDLPDLYGDQGEYYIHDENMGISYSFRPGSQPDTLANWIINKNHLKWGGNEGFECWVTWLKYYLNNFFIPSGYELNGQVSYFTGDEDDFGVILCHHNVIYDFRNRRIDKKIDINNLEIELAKQAVMSDVYIIEPQPKEVALNYKLLLAPLKKIDGKLKIII
jgi:hypothetical protein